MCVFFMYLCVFYITKICSLKDNLLPILRVIIPKTLKQRFFRDTMWRMLAHHTFENTANNFMGQGKVSDLSDDIYILLIIFTCGHITH